MDTELKKFNRLAITKTVAVLLCIICTVTMSVQVCSSLFEAERTGLSWNNCRDAIENRFLGMEENIWFYDSFISEYSSLTNLLGNSITDYGDGSEEAYKTIKEAEEDKHRATIEKTKEKLVNAAASNSSYFVAAVISGDIEIVNRFNLNVDISEETVSKNFWDMTDWLDYESVVNSEFHYSEGIVPDSIKDVFKGTDYDAVFFSGTNIEVVDYEGDYAIVRAEYNPGYYAFKVSDETLKANILNQREFDSYYPDYKSFRAAYLNLQKQIATDYGSARYFIRDSKGKVYTNIDSLSSESSDDEIVKTFTGYGTYSYSADGRTVLNDGRLYNDTYFDFYVNHYSAESYSEPMYETTTLPSDWATTMVDNGEVTVVSVVPAAEDATSPVVPTTSVYSRRTYSESTSIQYYECYIGLDENSDSETCNFICIDSRVFNAERIIKNCVLVCGVMAVLFVICLIYLIAKAGRTEGSEEIHLIKGDKIFTEIRALFDGGIIIGALFLMYMVLALLFNSSQTNIMFALIGLLSAVIACAFLDFALFVTRHIKNKSFWGNISIIWLIKKSAFHGKKAYSSAKEKSTHIKDKLLYTKELEKTVIIRTLIAIAINIAVTGFGLCFVADDEPIGLILVGLLFLFDLYILYRGIRFTGGVNKLFSFVKEMREGNLDIDINKNALPDYLMLPAENLQCLSEGLKDAVGEAIKQERTKTELITNVSHDLKTPLTSIINYVDLLKKCDIKDETAVSYLNVLSEKSDRLKVLIEDLVEASKASAGAIPVNFIAVSLKELISQIVGEFEESFEEKKLQLILDMPEKDIQVRADSKLIYRVFENLFGNIKKYALENTRVYITLSEKGSRGAINLKNISAAPLNISADELKERFVRGEQSRTTEGNGLGLSIAENFCTLQKGSLEIEINGDLFSVTVEMEKI